MDKLAPQARTPAPAPTTATATPKLKRAIRRIKRVNDVLTVVYVDAETGAELTSLDGYTLTTQDGFSNTESQPTITEPEPTPPTNLNTGGQGYKTDEKWSDSEWSKRPTRSKGTGDILGDLTSAAGVLKERVDGFKGYIMNGILTTAGQAIGRNLVQDKDAVNAAIGQGVDAAGNAITSAAGGFMERLSGGVGSMFGGGDKPATTPVTPTTATPSSTGVNYGNYGDGLGDPLVQVVEAASKGLTFGFEVVSGYRDPERNAAVGGAKESQHLTGNAMDISIRGMSDAEKSALVTSLADSGAKRIGIYSGNTGLHVDMAEGYPPPEGYTFYPMFDSSFRNIGNAPSWFVQTAQGNPLPEAQQYIKTPDTPLEATGTPAATASNVDPKLLATVGKIKERQGEQLIVDGQPIAPEPGFLENLTGMKDGWLGDTMTDLFAGPPDPKITKEPTALSTDKMARPVTPVAPTVEQQPTNNAPMPMPEPLKARQATPIAESTALGAANELGTGLDPVKKAYLDTLHYAEGNPAMNQAFGVNQYFDPGKGHPQTFNSEFNTSAAGKYQWTEPTWREFSAMAGVNDFSNEDHQDQAAWKLAEYNYNTKTGGNLYDALLANDPSVFTANANRWSSLPTGRHPRTTIPELMDVFTQGITKYNTPAPRPPLTPSPKIEQDTGFMRPKVSKPTTVAPTISTPSKVNQSTIANKPASAKTKVDNPIISSSSTGGFMPKPSSAKAAPNSSYVRPDTPTVSPKITTNTPIAGKPKATKPTTQTTPVSTKITQVTNTNKKTEKDKDKSPSNNGYSYNPSGR